MNMRSLSYFLFSITTLVVVAAQVLIGLDYLIYLNLLPLIVCFIIFKLIILAGGGKWHRLLPSRRAGAFGLVVGTVLPLLTSHIHWLLGYAGILDNHFLSSGDPIAFVYVPFVAFATGIVGCIAGVIIGGYKNKTIK